MGARLTVRKRNGRPKIMPPADLAPDYDEKGVDPHDLRAIAKAWSWRRKLDSGQVATIQDIAIRLSSTWPIAPCPAASAPMR